MFKLTLEIYDGPTFTMIGTKQEIDGRLLVTTELYDSNEYNYEIEEITI